MKQFKNILLSLIFVLPQLTYADQQDARDIFYSPTKALFGSGSSATTITSNQRPGENFTVSDNGNLGGIGGYYEKLENPGVSYKVELLRRGSNTSKIVNSNYVFKAGDKIRIHLSSNADGYMHALHKGSSGNSMIVPVSTGGRVINGQAITIPSDSGWLKFDNKKGIEKLDVVFASAPDASSMDIIPNSNNANTLVANIQQVALKYSNSKSLVEYEHKGEKDLIVEGGVSAVTPVVVNRTSRPASQVMPAIYDAPATYVVNTASEPIALNISLKHQ